MNEGKQLRRRLERLEWTREKRTRRGHEVWRTPAGELKRLGLHHVGLRQTNMVKQAERAAAAAAKLEKELMATTSMPVAETSIPMAPAPSAAAPFVRVYRSATSSFCELYLTTADAEALGGDKTPMSLTENSDGSWDLRRDWSGKMSIRRDSDNLLKVTSRVFGLVVPPTSRAEILAEWIDGGIRLWPETVIPRARGSAQEPRQTPTIVSEAPLAGDRSASPGGALEARQTAAVTFTGGKNYVLTPVEPTKRPTSIDDVAAALNLLRDAVAALGVTLTTSTGAVIALDDVEVVVRHKL